MNVATAWEIFTASFTLPASRRQWFRRRALMIRLAGGENVFADQPKVYLQVSKEAFATKNPAVFAIIDYEGNPVVPDEQVRAKYLFTTFPNLPASQNQRWVAISGAAFAAGIRIPDAVEQMARAFHPEAFE